MTELRLDRHFISTFSIFLPPRTPSITSTLSSRFISYASSSHSSKYSKQSSHSSKYSKQSSHSSKYSKQSPRLSWIKTEPDPHHPAFRPLRRTKLKSPPDGETEEGICLSEKGLIYKLKDAPFEFQYSYTETPKVKPLALREPPFLPFGPKEIPRPWTGRAPLPKSKKNIPEFDSFKPPPPNKKGVKTVQQPGPFLKGEGPRYNMVSREEILGAELTKDEVAELVKGSLKTRTQLNMGRDGLTHNMLDNIHAHWKRRRVCKIKCKGVCTVDMDNVCQQLEEKVGGKVILRKGGVIFLFRGRNYNYKTRPRFPLMLWKPLAPVYPKLIKKVPDGLTLEEANYMRKCGNKLTPICKLGKNGVYVNLVKQVREAFEAWELVRIECKGMNKSDYKKIGAKLKDLVPCVLLSFEFEHLLLWRGNNWKSSLPPVKMDGSDSSTSPVEISGSDSSTSPVKMDGSDSSSSTVEIDGSDSSQVEIDGSDSASSASLDDSVLVDTACDNISVSSISPMRIDGLDNASSASVDTAACDNISENNSQRINEQLLDKNERIKSTSDGKITKMPLENNADNILNIPSTDSTKLSDASSSENKNDTKTETDCLAGIKLLLNQAMGSGSAVILSEIECKDSDIVYQRSVELSKTAQPGPTFKGNFRKKGPVHKDKVKRKDMGVFALQERASKNLVLYSEKDSKKNINNNRRKKEELLELLPNVVPQGSLGIDELAKLLS